MGVAERRTGAHSYLGKQTLQVFIRDIRASQDSLHRRIAEAINKSEELNQENFVRLLLAELRSNSGPRSLVAMDLIQKSATTLQENHFSIRLSYALQDDIVEILTSKLRHSNRNIRKTVLNTLGHFVGRFNENVVTSLTEFGVSSTDASVALASIKLLHSTDSDLRSVAVPSLIVAFGHASEDVRMAACEALRSLGQDSLPAVAALVGIVQSDDSDELKIAALEGLLEIQTHDSVVDRLRQEGSKLQSTIGLLRRGGQRFRKLRQDLEYQLESALPLGNIDIAVLTVLFNNLPRIMKQYEIGDAVSSHRGTVGPALERLRKAGLTHRPNGDRGGETLTPRSRRVAQSLVPAGTN